MAKRQVKTLPTLTIHEIHYYPGKTCYYIKVDGHSEPAAVVRETDSGKMKPEGKLAEQLFPLLKEVVYHHVLQVRLD